MTESNHGPAPWPDWSTFPPPPPGGGGIAPDAPGFESVRIMRLQPGDAIVVTTSRDLEEQDLQRIVARLERVFPGHRGIVMDGGAEVSIAREEATTDE